MWTAEEGAPVAGETQGKADVERSGRGKAGAGRQVAGFGNGALIRSGTGYQRARP